MLTFRMLTFPCQGHPGKRTLFFFFGGYPLRYPFWPKHSTKSQKEKVQIFRSTTGKLDDWRKSRVFRAEETATHGWLLYHYIWIHVVYIYTYILNGKSPAGYSEDHSIWTRVAQAYHKHLKSRGRRIPEYHVMYVWMVAASVGRSRPCFVIQIFSRFNWWHD